VENKMIFGNPYKIAIQLEMIDVLCSPSGMFNFIINDIFIPGEGVTIDLYLVISSLKESLENGLKQNIPELGKKDINQLDFSEGSPENCIILDTALLSDYGCLFWLAFDGDEERLIYSIDYEKTFQEQRFPKGTIYKLISSLPLAENLSIKKLNNNIINTEIID
jgi:hypothetical protein